MVNGVICEKGLQLRDHRRGKRIRERAIFIYPRQIDQKICPPVFELVQETGEVEANDNHQRNACNPKNNIAHTVLLSSRYRC